ncbi:MAG: DegT/DnrJ/EryC1/StrS family aminotransferase [Magnetococcales bacterium]|nr:DegT/DnrJ/EryC1/StrS family aminotransferase [Magnetococcales bacterium]
MEFIDLKAQYAAIEGDVQKRMQAIFQSGRFILGPEVEEMEKLLAQYVGSKHGIAVASGTDALLIALMALGIGPGDEVITTPFTFIATVETIVLVGATPVLVDIDPVTYNLDANLLAAAITPRTRAIIPVSLYGQPAQMDEINGIAQQHKLAVIEDAAQSFGATYKGKQSCNLSTIGITSFFPSKPLGCYGDGGAAFTNDDTLATAMREIRVHGQSQRYVHSRIGVGGRMDTLQCAIILAKFPRFAWEVNQRHQLGARYIQLLSQIPGVTPPTILADCTSVFAQFTIRVANRASFVASLTEQGVPTAVHYPIPIHQQPAYTSLVKATTLPHAELAAAQVVSLPMYADMSWEIQDQIVAAVKKAIA